MGLTSKFGIDEDNHINQGNHHYIITQNYGQSSQMGGSFGFINPYIVMKINLQFLGKCDNDDCHIFVMKMPMMKRKSVATFR